MNAKCAISIALLSGEVLTIKDAFNKFGVTNLPREISRQIEQQFDVRVSKVRITGQTRYKVPCSWFQYRLNNAPYNRAGRKLMLQYVRKITNKYYLVF